MAIGLVHVALVNRTCQRHDRYAFQIYVLLHGFQDLKPVDFGPLEIAQDHVRARAFRGVLVVAAAVEIIERLLSVAHDVNRVGQADFFERKQGQLECASLSSTGKMWTGAAVSPRRDRFLRRFFRCATT